MDGIDDDVWAVFMEEKIFPLGLMNTKHNNGQSFRAIYNNVLTLEHWTMVYTKQCALKYCANLH